MIGITSIIDAITSHAQASGFFDSVNGHEPKSAPGGGMTCSVWVREIAPVDSSGLAATSVRVTFTVRLYLPFKQQPENSIDPAMITAVDALMDAYAGDFTFGGNVRNVDIRGADGPGLTMSAGYINIDSQVFRVLDITLPVVVNDVWTEAP